MPSQPDPIVQILIEAYKRGLAIQQNSQPVTDEGATSFNDKSPAGLRETCRDGEKVNSRNAPPSKEQTNGSTIQS